MFGLKPIALVLILVLVVVLILFASGYIFWVQWRNKKALAGKKIATILTPSGERHDKLLEVEGNQLWDKINGKSFPYMIRPDKSYDVWWPLGKSKLLQVLAKSFLYAEGNPEPIDPFERPPVMTAEVLGNLQDINFSRAMVGRTEEIVEGIQGKFKLPTLMYVLIGIAVAASLAAVLMAFL